MCDIYQAKKDTACLPMASITFYGDCDLSESVGGSYCKKQWCSKNITIHYLQIDKNAE